MSALPTSRLGDVAVFVRGINFKPEDVISVGISGSVACMRTKNVQSELDLSDVWGVGESFVKREDQYLQHGDILVSSANSWNLVGKCCWVPELPWRSSFGGFISALRADPSRIRPRFLFHWFSSPQVQATVRSFGQQTTNISNLNFERCLNLWLPLPPLLEQQRIVEVLDQAEALRAQRRTTLVQLESLSESIFLEMFGDPARNPKGWPERAMEDACEVFNDCPHSTPAWTAKGVICLRTSNLSKGGWNWEDTRYVAEETYHKRSRRGYVLPGDIVLSREGTVGVAAVVRTGMKVCMGQRLVQIRPKAEVLTAEYLIRHLLHVLAPIRIGQVMVGSTSQHLNVKELRGLKIPVPPAEVQREFVRRGEAVGKLKTAHFASMVELDRLFASLEHRGFHGALRPAAAHPQAGVELTS